MYFQIDRRVRGGDYQMHKDHYHPFYEFYYMKSGQSKIFVNHRVYHVHAGDMILFAPQCLHRAIYLPGIESERIAIYAGREYFDREQEAALLDQVFARVQVSVPAGRAGYMGELIQKMMFEDGNRDPYSDLLIRGYLYEMIAFLGRCGAAGRTAEAPDEGEAILQAAEYLFHHFREPVSLSEAAARAAMCPAYFSRRFKQVTGFGFKEYLIHLRIKEAAAMLSETDDNITRIALACGFNDSNYFGDAFRKAKGMSPREYRRSPQVF